MTDLDGGGEARLGSWESFLENRDYVAAANLLRPLVAEARTSYLNMIEGLGLDCEQARRQAERVEKELWRRLEQLQEDFESWHGEHERELKAAKARDRYVFLLGRLVECLFRLNEDDEALALARDAIEAGDPPFVCYEHCAAILGRRGQVGEIAELVATVAQEQKGRRGRSLTERSLFRVGQYAAFTAGRLEESLELARSGEAWCEERGFLDERFGFLEHQGRTLEKMRALDDAKEIYRRAIAGSVPSTAERRWMYPLESIFKRYMILLGKEKGQDDEIRRVANLVLTGGFSAAAEVDARKRLARLEETPRRRSAARAAVLPLSVRRGPAPELVAKDKLTGVCESAVTPGGWVLGAHGFLTMLRPDRSGVIQSMWQTNLPTRIDRIIALRDLLVAYGSGEASALLVADLSGAVRGTYTPDGRIRGFDSEGNVVSRRSVFGRPLRDGAGRLRGLTDGDGLRLLDDGINVLATIPCEVAWKVHFHDGNQILALLDSPKSLTVASCTGEILATLAHAPPCETRHPSQLLLSYRTA